MEPISLEELLEMLGTDSCLPDPRMYQYYKGLTNNTIIINDEINDNLLETAILPLLQMDQDPNVDHIDVIVNSGGGDIYNGFAFVSALERITTNTTIHIVGMAASMGGLIAMAKGEHLKTVCDPFSVGLIHSGSRYVGGSTHAVRDTFKFAERYEEKIKNYILSHTKIDEDMYAEIERQEFWMDADDMLKYNVVQEII